MKLVNFDQSQLLPQEKFFTNGVHLVDLKYQDKNTNQATKTLQDLLSGNTKNEFYWEQKGVSSFHLREAAFKYDESFVGMLIENEIPQTLELLTGKKLHLYHIQVVKTIPGPSYQDWHRDAYQYADEPIVGAFPPVIKFNFYPHILQPEQRLRYILGSHRCMLNDAKFDSMLISKYDHEILKSDNNKGLIFESSILHGVIPDENPNGSIRMMCSFSQEHEYKKRFESKKHHKELHDMYMDLIK